MRIAIAAARSSGAAKQHPAPAPLHSQLRLTSSTTHLQCMCSDHQCSMLGKQCIELTTQSDAMHATATALRASSNAPTERTDHFLLPPHSGACLLSKRDA